MSRGGAWEREAARAASEVTRRAIRRLDVLEWVILAVTVGLAIGGGWLLAWILVGTSSDGFRMAWMITAALLFIVPGLIVFAQIRRDARREAEGYAVTRKDDDG